MAENPEKPSRRNFLNYLLGGGLVAWFGSVLFPLLSYLNPPPMEEANPKSIKIGPVDALAPGSYQIFKFGNSPGIVIKTAQGDIRAFSAVCTHLQCIVQYRKDLGQIWCACHNGRYDLNGRNVAGPPPRPLERFAVNIVKGEIFVSRES